MNADDCCVHQPTRLWENNLEALHISKNHTTPFCHLDLNKEQNWFIDNETEIKKKAQMMWLCQSERDRKREGERLNQPHCEMLKGPDSYHLGNSAERVFVKALTEMQGIIIIKRSL